MRTFWTIAMIVLAAGCTSTSTTRQAALTQAKTVGPPQNCIRVSDISHTRIRDNTTIDFVMRAGGGVYRNVLPHGCPGLASSDRFRYSPATNELCSVETITVITIDGSPGATCGLGRFQRIELPFRS